MKNTKRIVILATIAIILAVGAGLAFNQETLFQGLIRNQNNQTVTRADLMVAIVKAIPNANTAGLGNCFPDVTNQNFAKFVCYAKQEGLISGYADGNFKPNNEVTRAEAAKLLATAFEDYLPLNCTLPPLYKDIGENEWYTDYFNQLAVYKIPEPLVKIGEAIKPADTLTRQTLDQWIVNIRNLIQ